MNDLTITKKDGGQNRISKFQKTKITLPHLTPIKKDEG
jgi:hypothetical protein